LREIMSALRESGKWWYKGRPFWKPHRERH
jgi:hypothetical protein